MANGRTDPSCQRHRHRQCGLIFGHGAPHRIARASARQRTAQPQPPRTAHGGGLILSVRHEAANNYQTQDSDTAKYAATLTCLRKKIPWRPGRGFNSAEPKIYGLQTAIVVGPAGEEIHTDEWSGACPIPPRPVGTVLLNNELAFGGQCRIDAGEKAARRLGRKYRLTPAAQASHPDADGPAERRPLVHEAFAANPVGRGFTRNWYVKACGCQHLPAPQLENPRHPVRIGDFAQAMKGQFKHGAGSHLLAGLGVRPKGHPERAKLLGTIDEAFIQDKAWLPEDFDFAIWNAAWPDQQVDELQGDEVIALTNLCASQTPGARQDAQGNTTLKLNLPGDECQLLVRLETGEMFQHPMRLDTVLIEPEERTCHLVWRAILAKDDEVALRAVETWLMGEKVRVAAHHEIERIKAHLAGHAHRARQREGLLDG